MDQGGFIGAIKTIIAHIYDNPLCRNPGQKYKEHRRFIIANLIRF